MIIDITEAVIAGGSQYMIDLTNWLTDNVGTYYGACSLNYNHEPGRHNAPIHTGCGWQIEAVVDVDYHGDILLSYQADITDEKMATFFVLKYT